MPTYDYECDKCSKRFELFQKMTAKPVGVCPKCGGKAQRLIGAGAGIIFKGSGFYQTDYKNKPVARPDRSCPKPKTDSCGGCSLNKKKSD